MTEDKNKKIGFVVDLNISRVLNTFVNYTIYKNEKSIEDKLKYLIQNHYLAATFTNTTTILLLLMVILYD